jgi:outer membrane cobalamin receptor
VYRLIISVIFVLSGISTAAGPSGRVLSESGEPLMGAAVSIAGSRTGTLTSTDGTFTLPAVRRGRYIVVASAVGYLPDTVMATLPGRFLRFSLESDPFVVPSVTVRSGRVTIAERTTAFVSSIRPDDAPGSIITVPELLDETVGVRVRTQGGFGSFTTLSIRGSTSEQVRIYLDGIPLNQAMGGGVNLATIPMSTIDQVDVYRGVIPPEFGGSGTAGVVNLTTRPATDSTRWRFGTSYGTWNTRLVHGWASRAIGSVAASIAVDYSASDNDFPYYDDNGTSFNPDDDEWANRTNNEFGSYSVLARASSKLTSFARWTLSYNYTHTNKQLPGVSTAHELDIDTHTEAAQHLFEANIDWTLPLMSTAYMQAYRSFRRDQFQNTKGYYAFGTKFTDDTTSVWGAKTGISTLYLPGNRLAFDVSWQSERYDPDDRLITDPDERARKLIDRQRTQNAVYLSDEINLFDDLLTFTATIGRMHVHSNTGPYPQVTTWSPVVMDTIDASYWTRSFGQTLRPFDWMKVQVNLGRYYRIPSLSELFGDRGQQMGNETLKPETGTNRDIGVEVRLPYETGVLRNAVAEIVLFQNDVDDMITYWYVQGRGKPFNTAQARIRGMELSGRAVTTTGLSLSGSMAWQEPLNISTTPDSTYYGNDLPHHPRWQIDVSPEFTWGPIRAFYSLHWHNRFFGQPINTQATFFLSDVIPAGFIHGAGVSVRPFRWLTVTVEGKNLGDVREFHDRYVPLPGRSWFLSLQAMSP